MNILLIAYYYNQPGTGGMERSRSLVRNFSAAGHRVTVLTAGNKADHSEGPARVIFDPSHNGDRQGSGYFSWLARRLAVETQLRLGLPVSIFSSWRRRAERALPEILSEAAPQVVLATYPPAENLLLGLHAHEITGIPLVSEFRDGLLFEPVERRALQHGSVRRSYEKLETRVAGQAAAIVTVSPPISRYFQEKYGHRRVATITNGYDPQAPISPLNPSPFTPGRFHVVHTGGISISDRGCDLAPFVAGVEKALAAAPDLRTRLLLHFAGRLSPRERRLLRPLAMAGMVRLYGQLPRETAMWMQRNADLLLLLASPDRTSVATGKLFEYMQAARPVLAMAAGTFAAGIITETGIGWTVPSSDSQALSRTLTAIMRKELAPPKIDERAIARYDQQRQCQAFLALLEEVRT